jgi:hypothetical protein
VRRPYYYSVDSLHALVRAEPMIYLRLSNRRVGGLLSEMRARGTTYGKFLAQYPAVICEPLDFHYICRRAAAQLNVRLLQDLLFAYGWREANWGAWLAALAPNQEFVAYLAERRPNLLHGTQVIDLALAACGEPLAIDLEKAYADLVEVVFMLKKMPIECLPMRIFPSPEVEKAYNQECEALRAAYRSGGVDLAAEHLGQGLLRHYGLTYKEWLGEGVNESNLSIDADPQQQAGASPQGVVVRSSSR